MKIITNEKQLREISKPVKEMTDDIKDLIKEMKSIIISERAVGLAHVQIAKSDPLQLFVFMDKNLNLITCINPEILYENKMGNFLVEECLSEPGEKVSICRSRKIKVMFMDENFDEQELELTSPQSNIWIHEFDHLKGVLIVDYKIK